MNAKKQVARIKDCCSKYNEFLNLLREDTKEKIEQKTNYFAQGLRILKEIAGNEIFGAVSDIPEDAGFDIGGTQDNEKKTKLVEFVFLGNFSIDENGSYHGVNGRRQSVTLDFLDSDTWTEEKLYALRKALSSAAEYVEIICSEADFIIKDQLAKYEKALKGDFGDNIFSAPIIEHVERIERIVDASTIEGKDVEVKSVAFRDDEIPDVPDDSEDDISSEVSGFVPDPEDDVPDEISDEASEEVVEDVPEEEPGDEQETDAHPEDEDIDDTLDVNEDEYDDDDEETEVAEGISGEETTDDSTVSMLDFDDEEDDFDEDAEDELGDGSVSEEIDSEEDDSDEEVATEEQDDPQDENVTGNALDAFGEEPVESKPMWDSYGDGKTDDSIADIITTTEDDAFVRTNKVMQDAMHKSIELPKDVSVGIESEKVDGGYVLYIPYHYSPYGYKNVLKPVVEIELKSDRSPKSAIIEVKKSSCRRLERNGVATISVALHDSIVYHVYNVVDDGLNAVHAADIVRFCEEHAIPWA